MVRDSIRDPQVLGAFARIAVQEPHFIRWLQTTQSSKRDDFDRGLSISNEALRVLQGELRMIGKLLDQFNNAANDLRTVEQNLHRG